MCFDSYKNIFKCYNVRKISFFTISQIEENN